MALLLHDKKITRLKVEKSLIARTPTQSYKVKNSLMSITNLSQNAKRASARKDTGLDQSLFSVQLFRLWISIIKVYKGSIRAI